MQNPKSPFNEAFYLMNSDTIKSIEEDYYTLIHTNKYFNKNRRFNFIANSEDYKSAIGLFEQFIKLNPNCKFAYNYCAIARKCLKDYIGAISDFTKAIAIDPSYEFAHFNRGHTQFVLENYIEAIKDISVAIAQNKKIAKYYEIRGTSKKNTNDYKGAVKDYNKCISLQPDNYRVYRLRAFVYLDLNNLEKAIEDFNTVYDNDYKNFGAYFSRGNTYLQLKRYALAVEDLSKSAQENPDNSSINSKLKEAKTKLYIEEQSLLEAKIPSKKPFILKAIATMDVSLLEVLLEDYKTYQDAPKETFIEKLNKIFEQFKEKKDSELIPHKGKCNGKDCDNKGCSGFSFIGNVSKSSIDLIFEETENNFQDIYNCSKFKINDKKITKKSRLSFIMKPDEKANFSPSLANAIIHQNCLAAYDKIIKSKQQLLINKYLITWINSNRKLYNQIDNDIDFMWFSYRSIDNFKYLFSGIENIIKQIDFEIPAFEAIKEYHELNNTMEPIVLKWLVTYEVLFKKINKIASSVNYEAKALKYDAELKGVLKYLAANNKTINQFVTIYKKQYWPMLEKYQIREVGVSVEMNPNSEEYNNLFSLKYNLEKSGIII